MKVEVNWTQYMTTLHNVAAMVRGYYMKHGDLRGEDVMVVGIAKGGAIAGAMLAQLIGAGRYESIQVRHYEDSDRLFMQMTDAHMLSDCTQIRRAVNPSIRMVVLIDDVLLTGKTMDKAKQWLAINGGWLSKDVMTCVLFGCVTASVQCDGVGRRLPVDTSDVELPYWSIGG
jgi:hypoxanthine phosphoribosyltransferase